MTDSLRNAAVPSASRVSERDAFADEVTDPGPLPENHGAPQRYDDFTKKLTAAAADAKRNRASSYRIGSRAFLLLLAGVATLLVGFGTMTAALGLSAWLAQSDTKPVTKPVVTTATHVVPPPSAAPAVTTPPASAATSPAVENEPVPVPAPPPESAPPATAPAPALPPVSAPNLNPAGKAPPGQNR